MNGDVGNFTQANAELLNVFDNPNLVCNGSTNYNDDWSFVGHNKTSDFVNGSSTWPENTNRSKGQGILRAVYVDVNNDPTRNTVYVGAGTSGLWKTNNANADNPIWRCITDNYRIPALGVNSIAVHPSDSNIIYISTGIEKAIVDKIYGLGIIKTTDGGISWHKTGISSIPTLTGQSAYLNYTTGVYIAPWGASEVFAIRMDTSYYGKKYDALLNELQYGLLQDSTFNLAEQEEWFKHPTNPNYHYTLAEMWWNSNNMSKYNEVIDSIPLLFTQDNADSTYYLTFKDFYQELTTWRNNGESMYQPDVVKRDWLLSFEDNHSRVPSRLHGLLKVNDTTLLNANVYIVNEEEPIAEQVITLNVKELEKENNQSLINLYPNPTKDKVTLEWKKGFVTSQVRILDINGKVVYETLWEGNNSLNIETKSMSKGMYFIEINTTNNKKHTRKLIITN